MVNLFANLLLDFMLGEKTFRSDWFDTFSETRKVLLRESERPGGGGGIETCTGWGYTRVLSWLGGYPSLVLVSGYPFLSHPGSGYPSSILARLGYPNMGYPQLALGWPLPRTLGTGVPPEGTWDQWKYYGMEMG